MLPLALFALASVAQAQGPDCSSATPVVGEGSFSYDLTGRTVSGFLGAGTCDRSECAFFGDVFFQWTCQASGDYSFVLDSSWTPMLIAYDGVGCAAARRSPVGHVGDEQIISDLQAGATLLLRLGDNVNSPDAVGSLIVERLNTPCSNAPDDALEENDTFATAQLLGAGSFPGLFLWKGDPDWYRFQVGPLETLRLSRSSGTGGISLSAFDSNCDTVSNSTALFLSWTNTQATPADIVVFLRPRNATPECLDYSLEVELFPDACLNGLDDAFEPNQDCLTPTPLPTGAYTDLVSSVANPDHYATLVPAGHRLRVLAGNNATEIAFFDDQCSVFATETRLHDFVNTTANDRVLTYRIVPTGFSGIACQTYDMDVSTAPDFCLMQQDDYLEENDTPAEATPLTDGTYTGLFASLYDLDHYGACVPPGQTLTAQITFPDNLVALDLTLLNAPGVQYTYEIDTVTAEYTNSTTQSVPVTARVEVNPILSDCFSYDFSIFGTGACTPQATPFCLPGGINSTGQSTSLVATFGTGIGSGLHLEANSGPEGGFGYFLVSALWSEPGVFVGDGSLCLLSPIGRYSPGTNPLANSLGIFDASGTFLNLAGTSSTGTGFDVPSSVPLVGATITPGDTWAFQLWHRDANPAPTTNVSTGLAASF